MLEIKRTKTIEIKISCVSCGKTKQGEAQDFVKQGWNAILKYREGNVFYSEKINFEKIIKEEKVKSRKFRTSELMCFCSLECFLKFMKVELEQFIKNSPVKGKRILIPTI